MVIGGTAKDLFSSFYSSVCSKLLLNNERHAHFLPQEPTDTHSSTPVLPHLSETKTEEWFGSPLVYSKHKAVQLFLSPGQNTELELQGSGE